jgi:hypothetical protein
MNKAEKNSKDLDNLEPLPEHNDNPGPRPDGPRTKSRAPKKKTITKEQGKKRLKEIDSAPDIDELKNAKIPTRRVRMLMVNPVDFMWLFTKGLAFRKQLKIIDGVPEDAKLVAVMADSVRNGIMLVVESASYDAIPINAMPPVQPVKISTGVKDATKKKKAARKKK